MLETAPVPRLEEIGGEDQESGAKAPDQNPSGLPSSDRNEPAPEPRVYSSQGIN